MKLMFIMGKFSRKGKWLRKGEWFWGNYYLDFIEY